MTSIRFHPEADLEVIEAAQYFEARSTGLGAAFLVEIEQAAEQIAEHPEACQRVGRRTRRKMLWRFPYSLFYAIYPDFIRILAVAHQKRRPRYWHARLLERD